MITVTDLQAVIRQLETLKATASERAAGMETVDDFSTGVFRARLMREFQHGKVDAYRRAISEIEAIIKGEKA